MGIVFLPLLKLLAWVYYLLPQGLRRIWSGGLAWALRLSGTRAAVIRQNLEIAFPGDTDDQRRETVFKSAYTHLARLTLEILLLLGPMKSFVQRSGKLVGVEHWREAKKGGRGILFLASHVGNWEVMAATGAQSAAIDIMLVTKHLKPEWLHKAIEAGRARCGVRATYEPKTLREVMRHLKRNGTVGFVLDQYSGPPVGVRVPFFNVNVGTSMALATLAKRTGAAVLPVVNERLPNGNFEVRIGAAVAWISAEDANEELALNTAQYTRIMEAQVRAHPDQWLWTHRRFKGEMGPLRPDEWKLGRARR